MPHDSLEQFTRQIANWVKELLEHGRYPFRKVAVSPPVVTSSGQVRPDLVLWINRPSCMAGGVLFFPKNAIETDLTVYAETAQSLGLSFFAVWNTRAIEIRQALPPFQSLENLPVTDTTSAQGFRNVLGTLLDKLKPLSVTGAIPPSELSAWHLVNLCLLTMENAQPAILESMRRHREEASLPLPEDRSENRCWHTLFHLLALASYDLLPETVHAERLDRAMEIATEALPRHLRESCQCLDPAPLPETAKVAFHHLFRRLTQIGWHKDRPRMLSTLECLLDISGDGLSSPLEITDAVHPLLCNPRHFDYPGTCSLLASSARLPGLVLQRELCNLPPATNMATNPFRLPYNCNGTFDIICGHLNENQFTPQATVEEPLVHLRVSWPNRRFRPPRQTPPWMFGLLHLLGLASHQATITLDTPGDWPRSQAGQFLLELLWSEFNVPRIVLGEAAINLTLTKAIPEESVVTLQLPNELRQIEQLWFQDHPTTALSLALYLPTPIWTLLKQGDLDYLPTEALPTSLHDGLQRFWASSWGQLLFASSGIVEGKNRATSPMPAYSEQLPLPPIALLELLRGNEFDSLTGKQLHERVEAELAQWFAIQPPLTEASKVRSGRTKRLSKSDRQQLIDTVFIDGIPRFPEQYLFNHYRPELKTYSLSGPLHFQRRFFNQVELSTDDGHSLVAESDLMAHALLLASHVGLSEVHLPQDEVVLTDIVQRYIEDLEQLHEKLLDQCNRLFESAGQARSLAKSVWGQQELPPWETLTRNF
ncbi:MAG: hypothetical protein C0624_08020 [Desulfuromonas sp.]|nr:MAG: hypothetical protein C0624_08020 [Desulfuromonas sp.]